MLARAREPTIPQTGCSGIPHEAFTVRSRSRHVRVHRGWPNDPSPPFMGEERAERSIQRAERSHQPRLDICPAHVGRTGARCAERERFSRLTQRGECLIDRSATGLISDTDLRRAKLLISLIEQCFGCAGGRGWSRNLQGQPIARGGGRSVCLLERRRRTATPTSGHQPHRDRHDDDDAEQPPDRRGRSAGRCSPRGSGGPRVARRLFTRRGFLRWFLRTRRGFLRWFLRRRSRWPLDGCAGSDAGDRVADLPTAPGQEREREHERDEPARRPDDGSPQHRTFFSNAHPVRERVMHRREMTLRGRDLSLNIGGRRRIRTSVGYAGDFTDRSLWPLGHPPGT